MGAERLLQSLSLRLKQNDPRTERLRFSQRESSALAVSPETKVFRSLIACKTFYRPASAKNFASLALLAMQHYRRAFQNTVSYLMA